MKPELLVWARESLGLAPDAAAKKAGVSHDRLAAWESGSEAPTVIQLRTLARIYKRPLAVFFLPEPPRRFDAMREFRRLPEGGARAHSPELNLEIRRARVRREVMLELAQELGLSIPELRFEGGNFTGEPDRFAEAARRLLRVDLTEQSGWRDKYEALRNWTAAVESAGVLVFQTGKIELSEVRGFSLYEPILPVIVVNAQDSPRGRVFTVLHEFAHILLRTGGLCDLHEEVRGEIEEERIEVFCNRVAGAMLVPERALRAELERIEPQGRISDLDETLPRLSRRFSVSLEVVLRRMLTIGLVSPTVYRKKRDEFLRAYERQEPGTRFASPSTLAVRDLGRQFVRVVVDAYRQEAITAADLAEFLGVRLKHLPKIEQAVLQAEA